MQIAQKYLLHLIHEKKYDTIEWILNVYSVTFVKENIFLKTIFASFLHIYDQGRIIKQCTSLLYLQYS